MRSNQRDQRRQEQRWFDFVRCRAEAVAHTGWQTKWKMDIAAQYDGGNSGEEESASEERDGAYVRHRGRINPAISRSRTVVGA